MSGKLYLLSTPIGNLDDMTFRAVKTLQEADLVAAEDTRRAMKLLNHFDIKVATTSFHMHNERGKTNSMLDKVESGQNVVVLSDAGTPAIADPGFFIVREAIAREIEPIVIPGVSALTFAAVSAGLPVDQFTFCGFLPVKKGKRQKILEKMRDIGLTCFVFESPYKIAKLLEEIQTVCGPQTEIALVREATKIYEETIRGEVADLAEQFKERNWKGELVVAIDMKTAITPEVTEEELPKKRRRRNQ
ncbi:MAG: 16S rRNA (cytidine(1402)-2'-O)-methyltransferase [Lentisphaeraceae bacterium]|nr:16S rRNA (cytidine(1402)-2'-O)-methyltransferase [Lentisphaeraceae bacterium]